jgi:hypothetical protein
LETSTSTANQVWRSTFNSFKATGDAAANDVITIYLNNNGYTDSGYGTYPEADPAFSMFKIDTLRRYDTARHGTE